MHSKVVFVKLGCAGSIDMVLESRKRFGEDLKWDRVAWSGIILVEDVLGHWGVLPEEEEAVILV